MLTNSNSSDKNISNQDFQNIANSDLLKQQLSNSQQEETNYSPKINIPINNDINSTSVIFNNLISSPRLSSLISENNQDNPASSPNSPEAKKEDNKNVEMNNERKNSVEDNYIIIDSDEENEEMQTEKNDNENKKQEPQKTGLQENQRQNGNNESNNSDKNKINDKDKFIDTEDPKKIERKLFYIRNISSNRKYKIRGKEKLNIQFFIGNLKPHELLPNFVFASDKYYFVPHKCRQVTQNYKGYIISFPGLKKSLYDKIIKKDLEHLCTYYFKKPRRKQTSLDIQVKDEKTLNDGVFLNDGIINFYLKIIEDEYSCVEGSSNNVLIMKSFFYNFIANQNNLNLASDNFTYPDSCSYIITKTNVFAYKTLIIPTCENYHWSLIIVNDIDKMKNIFSESNLKAFHDEQNFMGLGIGNMPKEEENADYPEIFYLDSFYDISQRRMLIILKYLFYEYQKIYPVNVNMHNFLVKNYYKIECYNPDVPKQDNTYDCGIFLLMYAELFLYNPTYFLQLISKKYKINKKEIINSNADVESQNAAKNEDNKIIINNNLINNININNQNNTDNNSKVNNIINSQSSISNNICKINLSSNIDTEKENAPKNNNMNIPNKEIKKNETFIDTENQDNIHNIEEDDNKNEFDIDKIDIQIEDNKTKENEDPEFKNNEYSQNGSAYDERNVLDNNDLNNNNELKPEEKAIRNWFSYDLVNAQRTKIKNLIIELSKIDKKKDLNGKMKEQNEIIKAYMERQKKEFDEYFSKLKESGF